LYESFPTAAMGWATVSIVVSAVFAYGGMFALGLPVYLYLKAKGLTAIWIAPICGFVAAEITGFAFLLLFDLALGEGLVSAISTVVQEIGEVQKLPAFVVVGALGAIVSLVFWFIARPDISSQSASG
jgi:putative flippase GtrA